MGALMASAIATVCLSVNADPSFIGGGNAPTYDTRPAVTILSHSGQAGSREVDYIITGHGMTSKTTHGNGDAGGGPAGTMGLFRNDYPSGGPGSGGTTRPAGTTPGSHFAQFGFDQVYTVENLWVWNWNETTAPNYVQFGWKHLAVDYSLDGVTWTNFTTDTIIPMADGSPNMPANLVLPLGGISAKYIVLTNSGAFASAEENWSNGVFVADAGLSEVRFDLAPIPEPASLGLLGLCAVALLRRRD
jgi:hypothetical protein